MTPLMRTCKEKGGRKDWILDPNVQILQRVDELLDLRCVKAEGALDPAGDLEAREGGSVKIKLNITSKSQKNSNNPSSCSSRINWVSWSGADPVPSSRTSRNFSSEPSASGSWELQRRRFRSAWSSLAHPRRPRPSATRLLWSKCQPSDHSKLRGKPF